MKQNVTLKIITCDRCGFEEKHENLLPTSWGTIKAYCFSLGLKIFEYKTNNNEELDLCPTCSVELQKWWNKKYND